MILTGLEEMDRPVPFKPISLIGAGLQVGGSHTALIEAAPG